MTNEPGQQPSALERLRALEQQRRQADVSRPQPQAGRAAPAGHPQSQKKRNVALGFLLAFGLLLWKFKALLLFALGKLKFLLVGLKLLKLGTLLKTGSSMLLMIWTYSLFYGWPFAAGIVLLILVHELGHGAAARLVGLRVGAPVFVPFFGAFIALKEQPRSTFQDFLIGAGGPLAGTLGGVLCYWLAGPDSGSWAGLLTAVGYFTLVINLFNLMPVWSLDGDRMTRPLTPRQWAIGLGCLLVVTLYSSSLAEHFNPLALFLLLVGGYRLFRALRKEKQPPPSSKLEQLEAASRQPPPAESEVTSRQRLIAATTYFALACGLVALIHLLHGGLPRF